MNTKNPSEYKVGSSQQYEWKPTGGIQAIAEKLFTPVKIEKFTGKDGKELCIVETKESFPNVEYKLQDSDEKVKGDVSRFFASPRDVFAFFTNENVMKDVNENQVIIPCMIKMIPFDAEAIKRDASLSSKKHYAFVDPNTGDPYDMGVSE